MSWHAALIKLLVQKQEVNITSTTQLHFVEYQMHCLTQARGMMVLCGGVASKCTGRRSIRAFLRAYFAHF